jgi:peptidoglycan/xylan/chitin deacetylase (PgdA/CDA1 family)
MSQVPAVLSIDFEFFSHTPAYRTARGEVDQTAIGLDAADFLIDVLDNADATATFFTVSEVANTHPEVVARFDDAGHEVGSHTHTHRHLDELSSGEQREELTRSGERLAAVVESDVTGFRAPSFRFDDGHFERLADTGYTYDSSVVPCRSIPGWYGGEYDLREPAPATAVDAAAPRHLVELPVAVMPGLGLPLTGTWIRFFGIRYTLLGMRWLARHDIPPVLYVHPWELVDLPAVAGVPKRVYWRSGSFMRRAVKRILEAPFEFVTARTLAESANSVGDGVAHGEVSPQP